MPELKDFLENLRKKHGTQVYVAGRLGITSQLLGQYEKGKRNPKREFYKKWKQVFNQDIEAMIDESNVSREAKNGTYEHIEPAISENGSGSSPSEIYKEMYEKFLGSNSEFLVIHRDMLKNHRLVSLEQIEQDNERLAQDKERMINDRKLLEQRTAEMKELTDTIRDLVARPINIQFPNVQTTKK